MKISHQSKWFQYRGDISALDRYARACVCLGLLSRGMDLKTCSERVRMTRFSLSESLARLLRDAGLDTDEMLHHADGSRALSPHLLLDVERLRKQWPAVARVVSVYMEQRCGKITRNTLLTALHIPPQQRAHLIAALGPRARLRSLARAARNANKNGSCMIRWGVMPKVTESVTTVGDVLDCLENEPARRQAVPESCLEALTNELRARGKQELQAAFCS